ncbi:MAG TPA: class I SAM-dependent methyltransferase [Acetobacteraceae bacterium]|nr:class I SAM-dependent methyltransferase [Acetobacteraceae bacterium]
MTGEVHGLRAFYGSPAGQVTARLARARIAALWPELKGQAVLGIGHAAPYLGLWQAHAARCVALMPPQLGAPHGSGPEGCATVCAEEGRLPFPDLSFDRVLLVHGLEAAENARHLLREAWRVLRDDGKLLVVVPNRRGLWAHFESTPFGHGQPYSPGQLGRLLERHMFRVERRAAALYVPPFRWMLRAGPAWERIGRSLWPEHFAGLLLAEAEKDVFAALPAGAVTARRRVLAAEPA